MKLGAWLQNVKTSVTKLKDGHSNPKTTQFQKHCASSSSSETEESPPAKTITSSQVSLPSYQTWTYTEWSTIWPLSSRLSSTATRCQQAKETATNSPALAGLLVSQSNQNTKSQTLSLTWEDKVQKPTRKRERERERERERDADPNRKKKQKQQNRRKDIENRRGSQRVKKENTRN